MKNDGKTAKAAKNDGKRQKTLEKWQNEKKTVKNGENYSGGRLLVFSSPACSHIEVRPLNRCSGPH